jgi:multidrug efflux system membrane fusion protein
MRVFSSSYFWALIIVIIVAVWLGTGTLIRGGNGPGLGEKPIISLIEPKGGAISQTLAKSGVASKGEARDESAPDPALTIAQRQADTTGASAPARSVQVKTYIAQPMLIEVPLRGQTEAKSTVTASAETAGIVTSVNVTKGQVVKAGDLLCTLDQGTRQAAVAQAQGALAQANGAQAQAQADYDTNATLRTKGLAAPNTERPLTVALWSAKASVAAAQAGIDNANTELARTKIFAKSGGVIQDPVANVGASLSAGGSGAACATIVQLDPIVFTGMVPQARIGLARLGLDATVKMVTGQTAKGKVSFISSVADAATRSFEVNIDLPNAEGTIRAGLTAEATVDVATAPAQLLPQSVLTLDDSGVMGIRAVENSKVVFYPVTIVKDSRDGMYVTGLPLKLDVITVGQEFVKAGDTVKAVQDTSASNAAAATTQQGAQS